MHNGIRTIFISRDHAVRTLVKVSLEAEGHQLTCFYSHSEADEALRAGQPCDLLLLDTVKGQRLEDQIALPLIERVGSERVCILAEAGDIAKEAYVRSFKIRNVLEKPLLRQEIFKMIAQYELSPTLPALAFNPAHSQPSFLLEELENQSFFLAASPAMMQLYKNIRKLATVDHPVLILGESGAGKEIIARLLHKYHARPDQKFINVNTAAIPSELLESELFGYEPGAFTGAIKAKPGKFELADKGTILLDEIGEMSPQMQAKLLHVLQDGSFTRLGGRSSQKVSVRILAATNVNMQTAIAEKKFREDLYYRISTFTLVVPSLRERREEIPYLIEQMAMRGAASAGQETPTFSARLLEAAQEYHWPGNLRELRNFVTRLLVLQDEDAAYEQLRSLTRSKAAPDGTGVVVKHALDQPSNGRSGLKGVVHESKQQIESSMIKEPLLASGWNRRRAAVNLNISYRALLYKIQQHGLSA